MYRQCPSQSDSRSSGHTSKLEIKAFLNGARKHLDATIEHFIQPDGSISEFTDFDIHTGRKVCYYTTLGAHDNSCWSRGQAWAIAGYLRAYEDLEDLRYLTVAGKQLRYWVLNSDDTLVPPWDFKDPAFERGPEKVVKDSATAAIVVEELTRLAVKPKLDHLA
jgi:unsaturated chondroitin disaccharide hydrolase